MDRYLFSLVVTAFDDWIQLSKVSKQDVNMFQQVNILDEFIDAKSQQLKFKLFDIFSLNGDLAEELKISLADHIRTYLSQKKSDILRAVNVIVYLKLQDYFTIVRMIQGLQGADTGLHHLQI